MVCWRRVLAQDQGGLANHLPPNQCKLHWFPGKKGDKGSPGWEPQVHRGLKEMTHPGNSEQLSALGCCSMSPSVCLRRERHQSPFLTSPSNLSSSSPFFFPISSAGEWERCYRCHSTFFPSTQLLTWQQTEDRGLGKRRREKNQLHWCCQPSKGLLTIVSSPETFISNTYSTCLQRPKSLTDTIPPLERRQGSSLRSSLHSSERQPAGPQVSCAGLSGSCRELSPRNTPASGHQVLTDDRGHLSYSFVVTGQNLQIIRILQADFSREGFVPTLCCKVGKKDWKSHLPPQYLFPQCHKENT